MENKYDQKFKVVFDATKKLLDKNKSQLQGLVLQLNNYEKL